MGKTRDSRDAMKIDRCWSSASGRAPGSRSILQTMPGVVVFNMGSGTNRKAGPIQYI
jgi:hypothetical protein